MRIEYGSIKVGVEEVFFYNPNAEVANICRMCSMDDCPVPDKDIVNNCNSFRFVAPEKEPDIGTDWRIIQGMTVAVKPEHFAYMANCAS